MPHGFDDFAGPATRILGTGLGSMGSVTNRASAARFRLTVPYTLMFVRVKFTGGTGSAIMTMLLDRMSDELDLYGFVEDTWLGVGADAIANVRMVVPHDEWPLYSYPANHDLVFVWANPDAGNMRWSLEVGLRAT